MSIVLDTDITELFRADAKILDSARHRGGFDRLLLVRESADGVSPEVYALYVYTTENGYRRYVPTDVVPYSEGYFVYFDNSLAEGAVPFSYVITSPYAWRVHYKFANSGLHRLQRLGPDAFTLQRGDYGVEIVTSEETISFDGLESLSRAYYPCKKAVHKSFSTDSHPPVREQLSTLLATLQTTLPLFRPGNDEDYVVPTYLVAALRLYTANAASVINEPGSSLQDLRIQGFDLLDLIESLKDRASGSLRRC